MKPFFGLSSLFLRPADSEPLCLIWHHNPFICKSPVEISINFKNRSVSDCRFIRGLTIISLVPGHSLSHRWIKSKFSLNTWHGKCFLHVHDRFPQLQILSRYAWKYIFEKEMKMCEMEAISSCTGKQMTKGFLCNSPVWSLRLIGSNWAWALTY